MGEEAMLNRVVLGTVRRIMGHPDRMADIHDQRLRCLLEDIVASAIAATVAQQQEGGGVWVVDCP
jgi:hypothetical protein